MCMLGFGMNSLQNMSRVLQGVVINFEFLKFWKYNLKNEVYMHFSGGSTSSNLRQVTVPVLSNSECNTRSKYNGKITKNM